MGTSDNLTLPLGEIGGFPVRRLLGDPVVQLDLGTRIMISQMQHTCAGENHWVVAAVVLPEAHKIKKVLFIIKDSKMSFVDFGLASNQFSRCDFQVSSCYVQVPASCIFQKNAKNVGVMSKRPGQLTWSAVQIPSWISWANHMGMGIIQPHLVILAGWWLGHPSEKYESQLGWWNSQYMGK